MSRRELLQRRRQRMARRVYNHQAELVRIHHWLRTQMESRQVCKSAAVWPACAWDYPVANSGRSADGGTGATSGASESWLK